MSLQHVDSLVVAQGLRISMAYGILVPSPGIEPVSSVLQHRFLNTGLPGKYYTLSSVSFLPFFLSFFFFFPTLPSWWNLPDQADRTDLFHTWIFILLVHFQFSSVARLCPTLCYPMDCSKPGFQVRHQLPELTQNCVHWASDAIQPSHPLSFPSPPAFNLFQHQSLFHWVSSSHQVAKVLEFQLQHQSSQWIFRSNFL